MRKSLLQLAREEGFSEGVERGDMRDSLTREMDRDDAVEEGRREAEAEAPSRFWWFVWGFCFATGLFWGFK